MVKLQERLVALDAFRGATIALMILVNNPGSWSYIYSPFEHADWHGCTPTDLVFPFFLFIVGVAMRFSFRAYQYQLNSDLLKKIIKRMVIIFLVGSAMAAFPFIRQDWDWSNFRIMGVLQRIALAYGFGAILAVSLKPKARWITSAAILIGYWLALWIFGGPDPYSLEHNLVRKIDLAILGAGHVWHGKGIPFDPEGLFSTLPAIVTVLLGYEIGTLIQLKSNKLEVVKDMLALGAVLGVVGWLWGLVFPINKSIWTSSYVLYTAGLATIVLAAMIWIVDIKENKKVVQPLVIFGTNSIFVFAASGIWGRIILKIKYTLNGDIVSGYTYLYETVFRPLAGNYNGSLLFAIFHVFMWWVVLHWMYRNKIFIKI